MNIGNSVKIKWKLYQTNDIVVVDGNVWIWALIHSSWPCVYVSWINWKLEKWHWQAKLKNIRSSQKWLLTAFACFDMAMTPYKMPQHTFDLETKEKMEPKKWKKLKWKKRAHTKRIRLLFITWLRIQQRNQYFFSAFIKP